MTNNNWEEELRIAYDNITDTAYCSTSDNNHGWLGIKDCAETLLTQKDQEHKAELEIIKGEIKEYFEGLIHVASPRLTGNNIVSIIDSHINKLTPPSPEDKEIK